MKYTLIPIIIIAIIIGILVSLKNNVPKESPDISNADIETQARMSFAGMAATKGITDLSLAPNETISGVYKLTGKAQGYMFEGSFPIDIITPTNEKVWQGIGEMNGQGNWMTTEPVPFHANINTTKLPNGLYTLVLKQDDPSGENKNLKQLSVSFMIKN
jgi:hypothetical protein